MKTDKGSEQTRLQRRGNGQQARHRHPRGTRRSKPQAASPGVATTGELDTTGAAEPSWAPRVRVGTQPGAASARSSPRLRGGQTKAAPPSGPARRARFWPLTQRSSKRDLGEALAHPRPPPPLHGGGEGSQRPPGPRRGAQVPDAGPGGWTKAACVCSGMSRGH